MVIRIYRSHLKALLGASGNVLLVLGGAVLLFCIWSYGEHLKHLALAERQPAGGCGFSVMPGTME